MIFAEAAIEHGPNALAIGTWVLAGGVVLSLALNAVKFWRTLAGDPERRAVNVLAENATKDEVKSLAAEIRDLDQEVRDLRREMKIDREALTKAAEERAGMLMNNIKDVLKAVSELSGVVSEMRERIRDRRT